jgi:transposase
MGRPKAVSVVDEKTLENAEADFNKLQHGKLAQRLLAIIAIGKNKSLKESSEFMMVTRQSVFVWVKNYKKHGLAGLIDREKGHRRCRLAPEQQLEVQKWLDTGKDADGNHIFWTIEKVKLAIKAKFDVTLSKTRVWTLIKQWGFNLKVPRPKHALGNPELQEAFKENFLK